ncbi:MAG: CHAT domain-containing protein [Aureispira sp.]|nr:CHAT domain-containing protein [Aureispira sp.]
MKNGIRGLVYWILLLSMSGLVRGQDTLSKYSILELDRITQQLYHEENYEQMIPYAQLAETKAKEQLGDQDTLYARMAYNLGTAYDYAYDDVEKAMFYYNKAEHIQKRQIPNSLEYSKTLIGIGDVYYWLLKDYEQAKIFYLQILALQLTLLGEEDEEYLMTLNNLGYTYTKLNQYKKATEAYQKVVNIRKRIAPIDDLNYCIARINLADSYIKTDDFKKAELLHIDILKYLDQADYRYPIVLGDLAWVYQSMGRYEEAEQFHLARAANDKKKLGENSLEYAAALSNLGHLLDDIGRYEEALSLYLEVMSIQSEKVGTNNLKFFVTLNNIAAVYFNMKKYKEAKEAYLKAKNILHALEGEDNLDYAIILDNLAHLYVQLKEHELAKKSALKAMQIRLKLLGKEHSDYFRSLNSLAVVYYGGEEYELAKTSWIESKKMQEQSEKTQNINYGKTLNSLVGVNIAIKNYEEANKYIHLALKANAGIPIGWEVSKDWVDHLANVDYKSLGHIANTIVTLELLYKSVSRNRDVKAKYYIVDLALQLLKKIRNGYPSSEAKMRSLKSSAEWLERGLEISNEKEPIKAFDFAEQGKSVLLQESINTNKAYAFGGVPDSLVQKEKSLFNKASELKARLIEKLSKREEDSLRSVFNDLAIKLNDFKENIEANYPKHAALKYSSETVKIEEIQHLLDNRAAFLEYVVVDSMIYLFYISKSEIDLLKLPISKKKLANRVDKLRWVLSNYALLASKPKEAYEKYTTEAYWAYQNLVQPALNDKKDIEELIIVTDGELGHLPFEAFLAEEASNTLVSYRDLHYLMKDYNISYNYSATLWKENKEIKPKENNHKILAIGADYSIKLDSSKVDLRLPAYQRLRGVLKPLPAAIKEVEGLSEKFDGEFVFGKEANEVMFKQNARKYGIIHLAMHGLLDIENPILSSLAFTENGDSVENNFLQAYEISKMELNAELVVLSACETGYGKFETGNGIASLARAFMYAGAPSLIVSLWQVNDQATSMIMQDLYKNLATGTNKAAALRQAKLDYIQNAKGIAGHPAFWSPFIQIGDSQPIEVAQKGSLWQKFGLLGGACVFIFGAFAVWRKLKRKEVV